MSKQKEPSVKSKEEKSPSAHVESWLTTLIIVLMTIVCLTAWWLAKREATSGAPGAPVGMQRMEGLQSDYCQGFVKNVKETQANA